MKTIHVGVKAAMSLYIFICMTVCIVLNMAAAMSTYGVDFDFGTLVNVIRAGITNETTESGTPTSILGDFKLVLTTGDVFTVDPLSTRLTPIELNVVAHGWNDDYIISNDFMALCSPLGDTTFDKCPLLSERAVWDHGVKKWAINVTDAFIKDTLFPTDNDKDTKEFVHMTLSTHLDTKYAKYFNGADAVTDRPLPLYTITFKNANVGREKYDERNLKVCDKTAHSFMDIHDTYKDTSILRNKNGASTGSTTTSMRPGQLRVYSLNKKTLKINAVSSCKMEVHSVLYTCNRAGGVWNPEPTWISKTYAPVSADTCKRWKTDRACLINPVNLSRQVDSETEVNASDSATDDRIVQMVAVSRNKYRSMYNGSQMLRDFESTSEYADMLLQCPNRMSLVKHFANCVLDVDVPMVMASPYEKFQTPYGLIHKDTIAETDSVSLSPGEVRSTFENTETVNRNARVHSDERLSGHVTLIWPNDTLSTIDDSVKTTCPYVLQTSMPVMSITTRGVKSTHMGMTHSEPPNVIVKFVPLAVDAGTNRLSFRVTDRQVVSAESMTRMKMAGTRCAIDNREQRDVKATSYLLHGSIFIQFIDNTQIASQDFRWRNSRPLTASGPNNDLRSAHHQATTLFDKVCGGNTVEFLDAYRHKWGCKHGRVTLLETMSINDVYAQQSTDAFIAPSAPAGADGVTSEWVTLNTADGYYAPVNVGRENHELADVYDRVTALYSVVDDMQSERQLMLEDMMKIDPTIGERYIYPRMDLGSPIHSDIHKRLAIRKAGDYWAVHKCEQVNWTRVKVLDSLKVSSYKRILRGDYYDVNQLDDVDGICFKNPVVEFTTDSLGTRYGQVIQSGREIDTNVYSSLVPCRRGTNNLLFNIGGRVYIFSGMDGSYIAQSERKHHPRSTYYNQFDVRTTGTDEHFFLNTVDAGQLAAEYGTHTTVNSMAVDVTHKTDSDDFHYVDDVTGTGDDARWGNRGIAATIDAMGESEAVFHFTYGIPEANVKRLALERFSRDEMLRAPVSYPILREDSPIISRASRFSYDGQQEDIPLKVTAVSMKTQASRRPAENMLTYMNTRMQYAISNTGYALGMLGALLVMVFIPTALILGVSNRSEIRALTSTTNGGCATNSEQYVASGVVSPKNDFCVQRCNAKAANSMLLVTGTDR